jgi:hypothetical protein
MRVNTDLYHVQFYMTYDFILLNDLFLAKQVIFLTALMITYVNNCF